MHTCVVYLHALFACMCVYIAQGGIHTFLGVRGFHTFAAAHTHTNTSDLTIHSTVIYRCDPSLSCFIMATVGDIIHK